MKLTALYKRVIALDVHQAKINACALIEHEDGRVQVIERDFGAFKRDRRASAQWAQELAPEVVVMESTGGVLDEPICGAGGGGHIDLGGQCPSRQGGAWSQDRCG